jgi:hypothetical protein
LSKQTNTQGIGKMKQQVNKNDWKQQALLNTNTECKWHQCPNQKTQNSKLDEETTPKLTRDSST